MDEQLFGEVSELLCALASRLPRRFHKAQRSAAAAAAAVHARLGAGAGTRAASGHDSRRHGQGGRALAHEAAAGAAGPAQPALHPVQPHHQVLHAGTVSRALWAFAMMGLHDDPVLPALMPHVRVRGVARVCVRVRCQYARARCQGACAHVSLMFASTYWVHPEAVAVRGSTLGMHICEGTAPHTCLRAHTCVHAPLLSVILVRVVA